jgi:hypothetical protein
LGPVGTARWFLKVLGEAQMAIDVDWICIGSRSRTTW